VLTCPCHLLLILAALAGTTAGAIVEAYWGAATAALTVLFVLSATQAWRAFERTSVS
jgi:mercuric ion transport protein